MPIDNTIALQAQQPDAMKTLSNILATQQQKLELSKARDTYDANVAETRAKSNVVVQTQDADITNKKEEAKQQEIATESKQYELTGQYAQKSRDIAQGLTQDPDFVNGNGPAMIEKISQARDMMVQSGIPKPIAEANAAHLITLASTKPKEVHQTLLNNIGSGLSAPQQASVINPNGIAVDDNQTSRVVNTNQMAGGLGQTIDGTLVKKQLPVTATSFNTQTNTPVYTDGHNTPAGPALGQHETALIPVASVKADFESTQEAGKKAAQNIGVLQNIKQYAPGAVTGVGQDRRSLIAGLGGLIGIEPDQLAKTNTDLLAKNANMLALAGGDTNLAKTLAEVANPNVHMTKRGNHSRGRPSDRTTNVKYCETATFYKTH